MLGLIQVLGGIQGETTVKNIKSHSKNTDEHELFEKPSSRFRNYFEMKLGDYFTREIIKKNPF